MTDQIADQDLLALALDWHKAGRQVAVAMVVQTWGSAPRAAGSLLVVDADGAMAGSVSGGCVEGAVIVAAQDALATGAAQVLDFGVSDDDAFAVGLACGGDIRILIDPVGAVLTQSMLENLVAAQRDNRPVAYVAELTSGARNLAGPADYPDRFRLDQSGLDPDGQTFVAVQNPPLRLIIVGAVHIAQPLVGMARSCGFDPVLVDPREVFGTAERFPDADIIDQWPDAALDAIGLNARTAVVTLTHDPKLDDPAILRALQSDVFYLGCLGSRRTHDKRVARLHDAGVSADQIARIHAPVGLHLGGRKPAEIAISIMAQIIATLRLAD